jgi:hypothetical protein
MTRHPLILIVEAVMYELLDQIRQLEIELAQALNRAKDSVALLEEAVQRLKDHRLELEAGEDQGVSKKNKQLRKITKKAVRKAFKQYWRLLFPPNFFTKEDRE